MSIMTREDYDNLVKKLKHMEKVEYVEIMERLNKAKDEGDLSENAPYETAIKDRDMLIRKIRELKDTLEKAKIIEHRNSHVIEIGDRVNIKDIKSGEEWNLKIVGEVLGEPKTGNPLDSGELTISSPIGEKVYKRNKGTFKINITGNESFEYEFKKI